jgi:hypothetical protein
MYGVYPIGHVQSARSIETPAGLPVVDLYRVRTGRPHSGHQSPQSCCDFEFLQRVARVVRMQARSTLTNAQAVIACASQSSSLCIELVT